MTKADLIDVLEIEASGPSKADIGRVLDALPRVIADRLGKGEVVSIANLGRFAAVKRAARKGRNPQTGESIDIPACVAVKFSCSKTLKDALN